MLFLRLSADAFLFLEQFQFIAQKLIKRCGHILGLTKTRHNGEHDRNQNGRRLRKSEPWYRAMGALHR